MKTLHVSIIAGVAVALIVLGAFLITQTHKNSMVSIYTGQPNLPPKISNIIIPDGSSDPSSGKNYEPRYEIVVLGVNNTIRWINNDEFANTIMADNGDDPFFLNTTKSASNGAMFPGKTFNYTFTQVGEFGYHGEPHPWLRGSVLVLPQTNENAIQTVTLNSSSGIPDPCETFGIPCPYHPTNYNFTAQKFGSNIYIEKFTVNGVDNYAIIKPYSTCYYPPSYSNTCTNPDDLAILRLVGVDTSIPQKYVDITISGLYSQYVQGEPISFDLKFTGYGYDACAVPSVTVFGYNGTVWQSLKSPWISCIPGGGPESTEIDMKNLGGPFSINKTGSYTVHVDYDTNSTESKFDVIPKTFMITNNNTSEDNQSQPLTNTNETGTIQLQNETYNFLVLNATMKGYHNPPLQTVFDGVEFTLLPGPWSGGPPGGCSGTPFRTEAKASDGLYIPLSIFVPDEPCRMNFTSTSLGWHSGLGAGLTINHGNLMILISKSQNDSSAEQIRIIPEYPITTGINKNGTITESETIEILFDNFKQNLPLVIQIFNPHGGFYKVDTILPSEIQSDGFYKYQIYLKGSEFDMGKYNIVITHGNATASTSAYLSNTVP